MMPEFQQSRPLMRVLVVVAVFLSLFLIVKTVHTVMLSENLDDPQPYEHSIMVEAEGKVSATPDIAKVSIGLEEKGKDVADVQNKNTEKVNKLVKMLKDLDIAEDDLQTSSYSVYPEQTYNPDTYRSEQVGWIVSQNLSVKIRDLSLISDVLNIAGQNGATHISGPNFEIDDLENLKAEARQKAMVIVREKVAVLEKSLGVKFEGIVGYNEWGQNEPRYYDYGLGGAGAAESKAVSAIAIEPGSEEVVVHVNVTYKIKE